MIFSVFRPLSSQYPDLISAHVTDFIEAEDYSYTKHWYEIGDFTLSVPSSANKISSVKPDMLLFVREDSGGVCDSLIITSVTHEDEQRYVLKGTDMKGLLSYRVSMFPQEEIDAGTYGYDVRHGSTGSILAGFIDYNCISSADNDRNIYGMELGIMNGGIVEDTYMSRLQPLNEIAEALCKNADIGYDISFTPNFPERYLVETIPGTNRTSSNLSENRRCIFADYLCNMNDVSVESKVNDRRNVIWVINGNDSDTAVVTSIYKESGDDICSFLRRESVLTANCDIDLTELYVNSKTSDMKNKTNLKLGLADPTAYGRDFNIGDIVTIMYDAGAYDQRILSVHKSYNASGKKISVDVGNVPDKKPFKKTSSQFGEKNDDIKELALDTATKQSSGNAKNLFISPDEPGENAATGDFWAVQPTSTEVARLFILNNNGWEEIKNFTYGTTEPASGDEGEYFCYIWAQRLSGIEQYVNGQWIYVSTGHTIFKDDTNTPPKTGDQWIKINNVNDKVAEALYQYSVEDEWVERYVFGGAVSIGAGLEYDAQGRLQIKLGEGVKFDDNGALTLDIEPVVNIEYGLVYTR